MWYRQATSNAPLARCAHAADCIDGKLYVFGGWSEAKIFNDLHVYDPDAHLWTKLHDDKIDSSVLTCRSGHSTTAMGNKLLIFGGGSNNETSSLFLNDIFVFDTENLRWQMAYACGPTPAGRTKHTATLIGSKLYVFGGGDGLRLYNDIFCLDIETMTWSLPSCKGIPPCPRWGHSTVQVGSQLVIFGGHDGLNRLGDVNIFDTETMTWRQEMCSRRSLPEVASPCAGHTATMVGPHMLVWGGGDGHVLTDMYALDTRTWQWWWAGNAPGTCAHTTTLVGNKLIAFGGGDGVLCFNDLYTFDVSDQLEALYQAKPNLKIVSPSKHAPIHPPPLSVSPPKVLRPMHPSTRAPMNRSAPIPNSINRTAALTNHIATPVATNHTASTNHTSTNPIANPSTNHTTTNPTPSSDNRIPPPNQTPSPIPTSLTLSLATSSAMPPSSTTPPSVTPSTPSTILATSGTTPAISGTSPTSTTSPSASGIVSSFSEAVSAVAYENGIAANGSRVPPIAVAITAQSSSPTGSSRSRRNSSSSSKNRSNPTTPTTTPPASPRDAPHNASSITRTGSAGSGIGGGGNGNTGGNGESRSRRNSRARKEDRPQTIAKWLSGLGMSKYLDRFVAEEIDIDILDMVNESHFKLLGIPLGDRLRLCAAISKISANNVAL